MPGNLAGWHHRAVLVSDQLVEGAVSAAGLDDFGAPTWRSGLDVLAASANEEARLTEIGELAFTGQITQSLVNRLRVVDWRRRHPDALAPIRNPVFVLGLPRTGTTLLSYLLDADPANRSLLRWEAFDSAPPVEPGRLRTDPRVDTAREQMDVLYDTLPGFKAIHYEAADGPTECITLHGQDFRSVHYETLATLPTYGEWHQDCDMVPAYEFEHDVLQVLQVGAGGRWVLKSPCHNLALDALLEVFPDARFVVPRRDPVVVTASTAKLVSVLSSMSTDHDFDRAIGARWLEVLGLMTDRYRATRARLGEERFHDIEYESLVSDPMAEVGRLYDWLGWPLAAEADRAMGEYLAANPKGRHGRHEYRLEQFGLTEAEVRRRLAAA